MARRPTPPRGVKGQDEEEQEEEFAGAEPLNAGVELQEPEEALGGENEEEGEAEDGEREAPAPAKTAAPYSRGRPTIVKKEPGAGRLAAAAAASEPEATAEAFFEERENMRAIADLRDLGAKAICQIKQGVRTTNQSGAPFVIKDWAKRFQETLGPYKKFLDSRPDQFQILEGATPKGYRIYLRPDARQLVTPPVKGKGNGKGTGKFGKGKFGKGTGKGFGNGPKGGSDGPRAGPAGAPPAAQTGSSRAARAVVPADTEFAIRVAAGRAIAEIQRGVAAGGAKFMPDAWEARYGEVLGTYKSFLLSRPKHFKVLERGGLDDFEVEVRTPGECSAEHAQQPNNGALLLAQAAREALAQEIDYEGQDDAHGEPDPDGDVDAVLAWAEAMAAGAEEDEVWGEPGGAETKEQAAATDELYFPAERATRHGSFIANLLSGGPPSGAPPAKKTKVA